MNATNYAAENAKVVKSSGPVDSQAEKTKDLIDCANSILSDIESALFQVLSQTTSLDKNSKEGPTEIGMCPLHERMLSNNLSIRLLCDRLTDLRSRIRL